MKILDCFLFSLLLVNIPLTFANNAAPLSDNEKANALFEQLFNEQVKRSPEWQTYLGIKNNDYGKWDDISLKRETDDYQFTKKQLSQLHSINVSELDGTTALSYQLFEKKLLDGIEGYQWRHYNYPVNQMFGVHANIPSFLINMHKINNKKDAQDYIARLNGVPKYLTQLTAALKVREAEHIIAPKFVYPLVIKDCENVLQGYPFDNTSDSTLMADFKAKVAALALGEKEKSTLIGHAKTALLVQVGPAYKKLIIELQHLESVADTKDGVWKFPQGEEYYEFALRQTTTTNMTANEVHQLGLDEVERIHREMKKIITQVKFSGTLKEFFDYLVRDKQFYYPNTAEGKQAYLARATDIINTMKKELDSLFLIKPKADLVVQAVEPFREKSAGKAFYDGPAPDGSRPGIYYVNLSNMDNMPIYEMEALAYHEGIPGHHMQISIAQELENIPAFRKHIHYTAYVEGWGLYAEQIPKDSGFYKNPYSDFGRLNFELWRACRLVVDTGIHTKQWTREQAIQYFTDNMSITREGATKEIERYIVMPSQATAYKIGMMKILQFRNKAQQTLGDNFDVREFHNIVLKNGAVPLDVLENLVNAWIVQKQITTPKKA